MNSVERPDGALRTPDGEAPPPVAAVPAAPWRRLSARMLVIRPIQEVLRSIPALLGLTLAGTGSGQGPLWGLAGTAAAVLLGGARWYTTTYRIGPEQVQVRRGLLRRRVLSVPRDRVRTVDVTAHVMHRALGLGKVVVGTGRSDRKEGEGIQLDALTVAEAERLRDELLRRQTSDAVSRADQAPAARPAAAPAGETRLSRLRPTWIRYGPLSLSGAVTIGVAVGFIAHLMSEAHVDPQRFGPFRAVVNHFSGVTPAVAIAEAIPAVLALVALVSTLGYMFAFWNFQLLRRPGGTLHVTRGLLTTRATTIEERRLRGVEISEPLLLRAAGGARCIAIATGLRVGRGAERGGSMLVPPAPATEVSRVATAVLDAEAPDPAPLECPLVRHPRRAATRRFTRALTAAAIVIAALAAAWRLGHLPGWSWQVALLLLPCAAGLALDRYRSLGHALVGGWLVSRWGSAVRRRCVLRTDGILGWNLRRSFFQRRAGLVTLSATTAAGRQHYAVTDIDTAEAIRLAEQATPGLLTPFLR